MQSESGVLFSEEQRFGQWWVWVLVFAVAVVEWLGFIIQIILGRPFGNNPAPDWVVWLLLILVGILLPWFFLSCRLTTKVRIDRIEVRFRPFRARVIPMREVKSYAVREYRPIAEYGGWGIRWSAKHGMAYNVSGNRGVQLVLTDEKRVLIGSKRPEELAAALGQTVSR